MITGEAARSPATQTTKAARLNKPRLIALEFIPKSKQKIAFHASVGSGKVMDWLTVEALRSGGDAFIHQI